MINSGSFPKVLQGGGKGKTKVKTTAPVKPPLFALFAKKGRSGRGKK